MSGNGSNPNAAPIEMPPRQIKPQWRKGHLLDENRASACAHLGQGMSPRIGLQETEQRIQLAGAPAAAKAAQRMLEGVPPLTLTCSSPAVRRYWAGNMTEQGAPDLAGQLMQLPFLETRLEICRMCPFWERAQ